ncbi:MAG: DUF2860 family protein [Deltaproteobacteria bacterium]|nr:DUF2860 family protein [Deltaproteobacteria bacterium]
MTTKGIRGFFLSFLFSFSILYPSLNGYCQNPNTLQKGIFLYQDESYEEAVEMLFKARQEDPGASIPAFFLGLAYKQIMDYENAAKQFQEAVTLTPKIKEALLELIDVSLQLNNLEETKKWIHMAEEQGVLPARTAFLKGQWLLREGENMDAVESFEVAKLIDPSISQAADVQIALAYLKERKLEQARERFQSAMVYDPQSDLAGFARQYLDMVSKRMFMERSLRFTLGFTGQYDTNMLGKWTDESYTWTGGEEKSGVGNSSFRVSYVPVFNSPWLFNAQYALLSSLHQKNTHTHDTIANSLTFTPGYHFSVFSLNLAVSGSYVYLRQPDYEKYMGSAGYGPLFRAAFAQNHMLELFVGNTWNEYFKDPLTTEEDRDSKDLNTYVSWIWIFTRDAFFNLRYDYVEQDTNGIYWDNEGHKLSLNMIIPLMDRMKFQVNGQSFHQEYLNHHPVFDIIREDDTHTFSGGLTFDMHENVTIIAQYSRTRADSNIWAYDYEKDVYSLGMEYRF